MFSKKTIRDIDLKRKTVLLRADFNVPVEDGKITDDYRIKQTLPTINFLLAHSKRLIICSHLGRPKGPNDSNASLFPVAKRLQQLIDRPVGFATDSIGESANKAVKDLKKGHVLLLENLRFYPEEENNDHEFAKKLASYADVFVQDGFGVVHRAHASTDAIAHYLPSVSGFLLEKEVDTITNVMHEPKRPLMAIIGGAKIADKIDVLHKFIEIADFVAVGGGMANTFLAGKGLNVEDSLYDRADVPVARDIMRKAAREARKRPFVFSIPVDGVVSKKVDKYSKTRIVDWGAHVIADIEHYPRRVPKSATRLLEDERILDIGPFSGSFIAGGVQLANTVIWNGSMGITEIDGTQGPIGPYSQGTNIIVEAMIGEFGNKPFTVVGGGDTVGYIQEHKLLDCFNHVSTGGGASLELMAGRKLPGVEVLLDK